MARSESRAELASRFLRGPAGQRPPRTSEVTESLRERKKRLTRQLISDTATAMFLENGFDEVRVADVAESCGVSEKTVYNYFPTKESLLFDREPEMVAVVRRALGPDAPEGAPVEAFVAELSADIEAMTRWWPELPDEMTPAEVLEGFRNLIETTPSLRAAERDMMDRVAQVAAEELAARAGVDPFDPEPQIAATAICALWPVMHRAMELHADLADEPAQASEAIIDDVRRAARLIDTGLWSFGLEVQGTPSTKQFKQAADAANEARKQVVEAVRAAKVVWRDFAEQSRAMHEHGHPWDDGNGPRSGRGPGGPGRRRGPRDAARSGSAGGPSEGRGGGPPRGQRRGASDGFDTDALRAARDEMRKAKRDLAEAKRETHKAVRQAKSQVKSKARSGVESQAGTSRKAASKPKDKP